MRESVEKLVLRAKKIADLIKYHPGMVRVVSHYDCDGICSAAIMVKALAREGKSFHLSFIKQLYEEDVKALAKEKGKLFLFLDMGSGQIEIIQKHLAESGKSVIISDHHQIEGEILSERVFHINPIVFGIEDNVSGSGIAYLLARAMSPENRDLSELAVIGAIGDSQIGSVGSDWGLLGLNREILKDAQATGKMKVMRGLRLWGKHTRPIHKALEYSLDPYIPGVSGSESGSVHFLQELGIELKDENGKWRNLASLSEEEQRRLATGIIKERVFGNQDNPDWIFGDNYELLDKKDFSDANEFATLLNATGKLGMGYLGVALCLNDRESFGKVNEVLENYRREIGKAMSWVYSNKDSIRQTENANYIMAGEKISEHVISNVVSIISRSGVVPDKPTFAFVYTADGKTKVSARASDKIVRGGLNLRDVVVQAARSIGGEAGGHLGAAGATIEKGSEETFINSIESIISNVLTGSVSEDSEKPENEVNNGSAESERGASGEVEGSEGEATGQGEAGKKMEGKGLVRYLNP